MRRYTVTINNASHVIDVEEMTASSFRVVYDGRTVDVRLDDHQDLAQAVIAPSVEVRAEVPAARPASAPIPVPIPAAAPAASSSPGSATAAPSGEAPDALTAPMPGVVLSVDTQVGAQVKRGDPVMVLEAMKMKNSLHAPRDGVVAEVHVAAGQQVTFGELLVTFRDA